MERVTDPRTPILAGFSHRKSHFREPVVRHRDHEINVALTGEGLYRLGGDAKIPLAAGEILLLPGGTHHGIEVQDHLRMAIIHFDPQVLDAVTPRQRGQTTLLARLRTWTNPLPARKVVHPDAYATLEKLTEDIVVEQTRHGVAREVLLQSMATQAAVYFVRLMAAEDVPEAPDETTRRILTVQRWIDRHFSEDCGVVALAQMASLAPTYFAALFRKVVGVPPMTYTRVRRLEQAKLLLGRTGQPAKVIGWSVGFPDVTHFHHAFRQATGLTPADFRARSHRRRRRK